jgi:hypothetical protein
MTTLIDEGDALVVRCDGCRRLWPISRERLASGSWSYDTVHDLHRCPVCAGEEAQAPALRAGWTP